MKKGRGVTCVVAHTEFEMTKKGDLKIFSCFDCGQKRWNIQTVMLRSGLESRNKDCRAVFLCHRHFAAS